MIADYKWQNHAKITLYFSARNFLSVKKVKTLFMTKWKKWRLKISLKFLHVKTEEWRPAQIVKIKCGDCIFKYEDPKINSCCLESHSRQDTGLSYRPTLAPLAIPKLNIEIKKLIFGNGCSWISTHNLVCTWLDSLRTQTVAGFLRLRRAERARGWLSIFTRGLQIFRQLKFAKGQSSSSTSGYLKPFFRNMQETSVPNIFFLKWRLEGIITFILKHKIATVEYSWKPAWSVFQTR